MSFKVIFLGQLDFKNSRSLKKAFDLYVHRCEVLYKNQVFFDPEEIFDEEKLAIVIPRFVREPVEMKWWKNTINLLEIMTEFAIAGSINAWRLGEVRKHLLLEPTSDKTAVRAFLDARNILESSGNPTDAIPELDKAIKKFQRHSSAYQCRGYVNAKLENFEAAIADYSKGIEINPSYADAYFGRALVYLEQDKLDLAIDDLEGAVKSSIPLQPIYWKSRRLKGNTHLILGEYEKAASEFKLFTNRRYKENDPNLDALKDAYFNFGKALLKVGKPSEALKALKTAEELEDGTKTYSSEEWNEYHELAMNATA